MSESQSISLSLSKDSIHEEMSMSLASLREASFRKQVSLSNEQIHAGDKILGTYMVISDAVSGGMGSVWKVHHGDWNTDLAMKRPQPEFFAEAGEERKKQFTEECENWIRLGLHPNIVSCYYVREIGGVPSIFSEWMDNGSLKDRIYDGTLYEGTETEKQKRILDIAIQTAEGLWYSHKNGLLHLDVKPGNILLTGDWDAKVADFGLAKAQSALQKGELRFVSGTKAYCPKEQLEGSTGERWMDLYAWALTVLEMYTRERLWKTGGDAREHCEEYFGRCVVPMPEGMREMIRTCLRGGVGDFTGVTASLHSIYRMAAGEEYPRPDTKSAAYTPESLNNRALSFLDLGMEEEAGRLWNEALNGHRDTLLRHTTLPCITGARERSTMRK